MKAVRADGTQAIIGDKFTDQPGRTWIFRGVGDPPDPAREIPGPFPGRVIVEDLTGNDTQLYPFEIGLTLVTDTP